MRRCAQAHRDVVGHLVAGNRNHRGVTNRAAGEHGDIGRAAADVDQADAQFLFVIGQHGITGSELLEHDVVDRQAAALHALDDVLRGALGARHDVHLGLETHARHADRLADAFLIIDDEFLRQDVQDLLVGRNRHGARRIDHAIDVIGRHFLVADRDDAVRVETAHMTAGNARVHRMNFATGHQLGFFDGALNRLHGGLDIHHHAFLQTARRMRADADHLDAAVVRDLADDGHHLGRADVETDDQVAVALSRHQVSHPRVGGPCVQALMTCRVAGDSGVAARLQPTEKPLL